MRFSDIPMLTAAGSYEVNVPLDMLDDHIRRYQEEGDSSCPPLNLLPDFQRGHVWGRGQQIAYVEFFLRGGMTGRVIYLNYPAWGHFRSVKLGGYREFVIVDGLQRLTALLAFVRGELPAFGCHCLPKGTEPKPGVVYFEDRVRMADANSNLKINVNNIKTREGVLRWYLEMNEGGTPHTQQELDKVRMMIQVEKGNMKEMK